MTGSDAWSATVDGMEDVSVRKHQHRWRWSRGVVVSWLLAASGSACADGRQSQHSARDSNAAVGGRDTAAAPLGVLFDPPSLAPGSQVAGLTVEQVEATRALAADSSWVGSAHFRGEVTLAGRTLRHFDYPDAQASCFEADSASARKLPRWRGDERRPWFCFENDTLARRLLGPPGEERPARIVIDRFTIHRGLSDQVNAARLVRLATTDEK